LLGTTSSGRVDHIVKQAGTCHTAWFVPFLVPYYTVNKLK
jgi:hypothetical protein